MGGLGTNSTTTGVRSSSINPQEKVNTRLRTEESRPLVARIGFLPSQAALGPARRHSLLGVREPWQGLDEVEIVRAE